MFKFFMGLFITTSRLYLFIKGGVRDTFNLKKIYVVIKKQLSLLALTYLVTLLGSMAMSVIDYIPFVGLIFIPFIMNMIYHLTGQVFAELDRRIIEM